MLAVLACSQAASAEELRLGILHVNDTHGHLLPFNYRGEDGWGGAARLCTALEKQRGDNAYYWLTLHAGDAFQAMPLGEGWNRLVQHSMLQRLGFNLVHGDGISNLYSGELDIGCLNRCGFDAMCLGNHDFDFGLQSLRQRIGEAQFAMLSANLQLSAVETPFAATYTVLQRGPYRIGVIGLTTTDMELETECCTNDCLAMQPAIPVAQRLATELRAQGCDIVIALTHLGLLHDIELASSVPGLDVVIGGHTHSLLAKPFEIHTTGGGTVLVNQSGYYGTHLGVLKLVFERVAPSQRFKLRCYTAEQQPLAPHLPQDAGVTQYLEAHKTASVTE